MVRGTCWNENLQGRIAPAPLRNSINAQPPGIRMRSSMSRLKDILAALRAFAHGCKIVIEVAA
jgi:hypothetical protein